MLEGIRQRVALIRLQTTFIFLFFFLFLFANNAHTPTGNNHLVVFGGMGHRPDAASADDLCVLNDVRFFDLARRRWLPPDGGQQQGDPIMGSGAEDGPLEHRQPHLSAVSPSTPAELLNSLAHPSTHQAQPQTQPAHTHAHAFTPRARYAHLSSVTAHRLVVIGGQDLNNVWLDDVCVFDLRARRWAARRPYPRHAGTYRSVAVAAELRVRFPGDESRERAGTAAGRGFRVDAGREKGEHTPSESLVHLPYSTEPTDEFPNDIYLYSNYNVSCSLLFSLPLAHTSTSSQTSSASSRCSRRCLAPGATSRWRTARRT